MPVTRTITTSWRLWWIRQRAHSPRPDRALKREAPSPSYSASAQDPELANIVEAQSTSPHVLEGAFLTVLEPAYLSRGAQHVELSRLPTNVNICLDFNHNRLK